MKLYIYIVLLLHMACHSTAELKLVQVLFRHGDRSPVYGYPNDPNNITSWKDTGALDYGQLTTLGMRQHYLLGQFFREKYVDTGLLKPYYDPTELYVRSTDVDRTLMSAYSNLAGFYPPDSTHHWWPSSASLNWQPIPVHTVPQLEDNLLNPEVPCPKSEELYKEEQQTREFRNQVTTFKNLLDFAANKSGNPTKNLDLIWELTDTLFCETTHNMTQPDWVHTNMTIMNRTQSVYSWLLEISYWEFDLKFGEPNERARLRGGPLLKEMLENIRLNMEGNSTRKFYMYSAHDSTVMAFLHALRASNHLQPPYTATVIVELHQVNGSYGVQLAYRNESGVPPYPLSVPGCKLVNDLCPLDQLKNLTADMVPGDWASECQPAGGDSKRDMRFVIGVGVGCGLVFVMLIVAVVFLAKRQRRAAHYDGYMGIQEQMR